MEGHMIRLKRISIYILVSILLLLIQPSYAGSAASILYVTKAGYDGYDCLTPATACGSIDGALYRAADGDTIEVTAETFYGYGEEVVYINKDISLSGGWDQAFSNRIGRTTIDGQGARQGIEIVAAANAHIESFIVQNGLDTLYSGGITNWGTLSIDNSILQYNHGPDPTGGGMYSYGPATVTRSTFRKNIGNGIYSITGPLSITDSTISDNSNGGVLIFNQNASIVNSTISGNENPGYSYDGGGIYYAGTGDQALLLRNVTITLNQAANSGGGIYMFDLNGGEILMVNSILAGNSAGTQGPDCYGPIDSQGYNLIGDALGCTFSSSTGDQLDTDPMINPLTNNGGPNFTHRLVAGSPAIDAGNPDGCPDKLGNPLTSDQRGFTRPLDGNGDGILVCDVGAYEYDPLQVILFSFLPLVKR
jgi:hypothetical protein